ncbi:Global transcription regulator sge1 [Leucoagaricus gongylophorus]
MSTQYVNPIPTWAEPPWSGWIETTGDALLILEAARRGLIPRVTRRLIDSERKMITSGSVFVFDEDESGIKRWTDGLFWSPSRILGNFLLYREIDKRGNGGRSAKEGEISVNKQRERTLLGSLTNVYRFKQDGLMKKTFSLSIGGASQHLISYYKVEDVESGRLRSPSSLPELASLEISPEYLDKTHFRNPPKVEMCADGILRYRGEPDDIDTSVSLLTGPLTGLPLLSSGREGSENATSKRTKRFEPYSRLNPLAPKRQRKTLVMKSLPEPMDGSQLQQHVTTIPTPTGPQEAQVSPQEFAGPSSPPTTSTPVHTIVTPAAPYPLLDAAPYYGYVQPSSHIPTYLPQPGYPSGQSIPPPSVHSGQYMYAGYPPSALIPQMSSTAKALSPSTPAAAVPPVTASSDPSQAQTSGTATSSSQTQSPVNPQTQSQVGYYPHVPQPHLFYPTPHGPAASGVSPSIYAAYPSSLSHSSHSGHLPLSSLTVWTHHAPYGSYPPLPPQQAPPSSSLSPQSYSYLGVYPAPVPPPLQQVSPPHQQSSVSPG